MEPGELRTASGQRVGGRQDEYSGKLSQISELISSAGPDLVAVQEVLADPEDPVPQLFDDPLAALGAEWNGCLSQRPDECAIRVGWLFRGQLNGSGDVADYPHGVPATTVDDQGTVITAAKRGAGGHLHAQ